MKTRKYSLIVEGSDDSGYSAYVPELPTILVAAQNMEELTTLPSEAIRIYFEFIEVVRRPGLYRAR
jgi:predicted RNase H-like HicB family nuclease